MHTLNTSHACGPEPATAGATRYCQHTHTPPLCIDNGAPMVVPRSVLCTPPVEAPPSHSRTFQAVSTQPNPSSHRVSLLKARLPLPVTIGLGSAAMSQDPSALLSLSPAWPQPAPVGASRLQSSLPVPADLSARGGVSSFTAPSWTCSSHPLVLTGHGHVVLFRAALVV